MIILDMNMPNSCETCKLQFVCPVYQNVGTLKKDKLKLDKNRHPKCIIKGVALTETIL